jgi:hypothetical protein
LANPDVVVEQTSFVSLKPYFVKSLRDRNVCCCKYHTKLVLLKDALNHL